MADIYSQAPVPYIPDNLTIPQFFLDSHHPLRPIRTAGFPVFIEDKTGRTIGFEEARTRAYGLANGLSLQFGMGEDDVVCLFAPNHVDYAVALWAVHRLGSVITPSNPTYTDEELVHQLRVTQSSFVIAHSAFIHTASEACLQVGIKPDHIILLDQVSSASRAAFYLSVPGLIGLGLSRQCNFVERQLAPGEAKKKLAILSMSSGTTGKPKAVAISHYALIANVVQLVAHHADMVKDLNVAPEQRRFRPGDTAVAVLPFFHIYGLVVLMHKPLFEAMALVVVSKFEFSNFLDSIVRHRVTHLFVVPPMVILLCKHPLVKKYNLSHVHFCCSGAAPLSSELVVQLAQVLPTTIIGQGYGMTETCTVVTLTSARQWVGRSGSAGSLLPGIVARIVKADGTLANPGEPGELMVHSPSNALGYIGNDRETRETFIDGWVRTGDEVIYNEVDEEFFIVDRLKELIKVRGFQVSPAELEGHLLSHPDIADACVVGVPDDFSGEVPLAFIVLRPHVAQRTQSSAWEADKMRAAISKHVSDAKTKYKWLAGGVEFLDVIPKTPSGKMLRRVLREKAKALRAESSRLGQVRTEARIPSSMEARAKL
ncbi:hypothetical protein EW146_g2444 [Bondarzewia mesenterica]|uniref:4-coumarate--CoA ligase n=1 Tax=Bondarzewia mesenterica TaxID=1095465 RepID=A0A4S4M0M4_9AGAM|nr:hypothetical protein EW146_g2444 [Bondarzewia mesenterica]